MNPERERLIWEVFSGLRREGLSLGIAELLAALNADRAGYAQEPDGGDDLPGLLALLWCKGEADRWRLNQAYETAQRQTAQPPLSEQPPPENLDEQEHRKQELPPPRPPEPVQTPAKPGQAFGVVPTRAPPVNPSEERRPDYHYPLSRRDMRYAWRYLRRVVADGPCDVLDVAATVEQVARQGFYLAPVLRRRERNHAHLVLMFDHLGSMIPFHHYLRGLAETAQNESGLGRVEVYYFQNVPGDALYTDALLQKEQTPIAEVLASLDETSAVLVVSDAGAARHHNELERILASLEFLDLLRGKTRHVAWLNPMPETRWRGNSAESLARHVPMFPMNQDGLSQAVDSLRGLRVGRDGR